MTKDWIIWSKLKVLIVFHFESITKVLDNLQYNTLGHWVILPRVWWSKYYFDRCKIKQWVAGLDLGHSKLFTFAKILQEIIKRIMLGTSAAWSMSWLNHRPSNPATQRIVLNTCGNYNNSLNSLSRPSNQQNVRCCLLIMKIKALVTLWYIPLRQSNASLYVFLNVHMYCNQSCIQHLYVETLHLRH